MLSKEARPRIHRKLWTQIKNPPDKSERVRELVGRNLCRAHDVARLEALRAFEQIELDSLAFVQRAVTVLLDGGEMHEHILARGALDKSVSFRPVEPLHSTLLSHKETPFPSSLRIILPSLAGLPDRGSPQNGVRIFGWRRRARAIPHQQKRLPCISSNSCPRRNAAKPRKRRRDFRLLTQQRQSC